MSEEDAKRLAELERRIRDCERRLDMCYYAPPADPLYYPPKEDK